MSYIPSNALELFLVAVIVGFGWSFGCWLWAACAGVFRKN